MLIPVVIGLFGVSEILLNFEHESTGRCLRPKSRAYCRTVRTGDSRRMGPIPAAR